MWRDYVPAPDNGADKIRRSSIAFIDFGISRMALGMRLGIIGCAGLLFLLPLLESRAAQLRPRVDERLKNIERCNRTDRESLDSRIQGCTALINAQRKEPMLVLTIAHNNRGNAFFLKGDYDNAIKDYESAIQLNPNDANPYNNRGVLYRNKGDYDRAIQDFGEAIKLKPDYAQAYANRAEAYQFKNDYERAIRDYDSAIRIEPDLEPVWNGRCWSRAIVGQLQEALTDCNKALGLQPNAAVYDSRGLVYLKLGQYDLAIADYNSAVRLEPTLASAFYGRGLAKMKKGDKSGGEADVSRAKALKATIDADFSRYGIQ